MEQGILVAKEYLPITKTVLLKLLFTFTTITAKGFNLHAIYCLAFTEFLRISEFTYSGAKCTSQDFAKWHSTRGSVSFFDQDLCLKILSSKTDHFRQSVKITIAASRNDACPVDSPCRFFNIEKRPQDSAPFDINSLFYSK